MRRRARGTTVEGYRVGDTAIFLDDARGRVPEGETLPRTDGRGTGLDRERNLVTVSYSFTTGKGERAGFEPCLPGAGRAQTAGK